jgi:hypothetical protein
MRNENRESIPRGVRKVLDGMTMSAQKKRAPDRGVRFCFTDRSYRVKMFVPFLDICAFAGLDGGLDR